MRHARIILPGWSEPRSGLVSQDGTSVRFGGQIVTVPEGAWAPAVTGWIFGPVLNEQSSLDRFGEQLNAPPYQAPPTVPVLYFKPRNTHLGHGGRVSLPAYAETVELGASIGMVFKSPIARATPEQVSEAVAGYTIVLDLSVPNASIYRPPIQEKCFDQSCPVGPWVVGREDIPDPSALVIRTYVNGALAQTRGFSDAIRFPFQLAADVSDFMTLSAGDTLTLGYPVGDVPTAKPGDRIRIEVDGIGALDCILEEKAA